MTNICCMSMTEQWLYFPPLDLVDVQWPWARKSFRSAEITTVPFEVMFARSNGSRMVEMVDD